MSLSTLHPSVYKRTALKPKGLTATNIPTDMRLFIETEALDIYTSMVNSGASLQATLLSVYMSGMSAANAAIKAEGGKNE